MAIRMGHEVPEATNLAPENRPAVRSLNLNNLRPGTTVEITTKSGSMYWVTITTHRRVDGDKIYGISLMTSSETFGQVTRSPQMMSVGKIVRIGEQFDVGSVKTSRVSSYRTM